MTAQPTPTYATVAPPSRPLGVAILAVLVGLYGFLLLLAGLLVLAGVAVTHFLGVPTGFAGLGSFALGLVVFIVGLIILGLALGLWHLRMWALVLTLLFVIFEMISYGIAGAFVSLGFILAFILFIYLLAVHRHFT